MQRTDLNAIEEAAGYEQLIADVTATRRPTSREIIWQVPQPCRAARLPKLPTVRDMLVGRLRCRPARARATDVDPTALRKRIVEKGFGAR